MTLAHTLARPATILVSALFALSSCGTYSNYDETLLESMIYSPSAPTWLTDGPSQTDDEFFFIGRSVCYDVLDERRAFDMARDHALEQYGRMVRSEVHANSGHEEHLNSSRYLAAEPYTQGHAAAGEISTSAVVGDLLEVDSYWEKYKITGCCNLGICELAHVRYKCWVLLKVPAGRVASRIEETAKLCAPKPAVVVEPPCSRQIRVVSGW